jgi:hypothetical protein
MSAISGTNLDWSKADPSLDCARSNPSGQRNKNRTNAEMHIFFNFIGTPQNYCNNTMGNNKNMIVHGALSNTPNPVALNGGKEKR